MKSSNDQIFLHQHKVENYQGIKNLVIKDLPDNAPWIFLTGENGFGKTSLLKSITIGLFGPMDGNQVLGDGKSHNAQVYVNGQLNDNLNGPFLSENIPIIAYGASRMLSLKPSRSETSSPIRNLFQEDGDVLNNIEDKLLLWHYKKEKDKLTSELYKSTLDILLNIMPNLSEIKIDEGKDRVVYIEKNSDTQLVFSELASGNKTLISWVGDLIGRLVDYYPSQIPFGKQGGIVLIDELDVHLHPKWQKELPDLLSKAFPKMQFIASTHSPIPLLGAPKNSVVLNVTRSKEEGVQVQRLDDKIYFEDLLPNTLLTSPVFGMDDIFSKNSEKVSPLASADSFEELEDHKEKRKKIKAFLNHEKEQELVDLFEKRRNRK